MNLNGQTIGLQIDNSEATINGRKVMMDVPAQIINDTTMVPIRFVSENFNQEIAFDNETRKITIVSKNGSNSQDKPLEPSPVAEQPQDEKPAVEQPKEASPVEEPAQEEEPEAGKPAAEIKDVYKLYIGTWQLWIPGVANDVPGGKSTVTTGSTGGVLIIKPDLTWQYTLGSNVFTGVWSPIENSSEILLSHFQYNTDWQVRMNRGKFQVYTFGMYFEGERME